jgi:hypothetical protein
MNGALVGNFVTRDLLFVVVVIIIIIIISSSSSSIVIIISMITTTITIIMIIVTITLTNHRLTNACNVVVLSRCSLVRARR